MLCPLGGFLAIAIVTSAQAATFEHVISGLQGTFETHSSVTVELGQQFEEVTDLSLRVSGFMSPQLREICREEECSILESRVHVIFSLFDLNASVDFGGGLLPDGEGTTFTLDPRRPTNFDFLMDGSALAAVVLLPEQSIGTVIRPGSITLTDVRLLVTGTPIPEPSTAWLLAFGITLLSTRRSSTAA